MIVKRQTILLIANIAWLAIILLLGAWWGNLLIQQSEKILALEHQLCLDPQIIQAEAARFRRMLTWEIPAFFIFVLGSSGVFLWFYWRDHRRSKSIQAFFASVTHDMRTPLTSIRLQAETLSEQTEHDASIAKKIRRLLDDTSRLETQVNRTLEFARVEGGGSVTIDRFRLKPWIEKWIKDWNAESLHGTHIRLSAKSIADVLIEGDPIALDLILRNLMENSARHAGQSNVEVLLSTELKNSNSVTLLYQDNGRGFSGNSKRLGELFFKGERSQGTGVGLYLIRVLIGKMGGNVQFIGTPHFSAQLSLRIPSDGGAYGT